jgi:multidrug efflux pump subunit AcrA (membrane-fusion protein)
MLSPPEDPDEALNRAAGHLVGLSWTEADLLVRDMATGATTARLNHRQRWALLIVLGLLDRSRQARSTQERELRSTHAERKQLRKALDDMRQERDRERKRADLAERELKRSTKRGRPGCGKIPLGNAAEAQQYIEVRCAATGEHHSDYMTYTCTQGCEPVGSMQGVWHIGHVATRAERETAPEGTGRVTDYAAAARRLGLSPMS